MTIQPDAAAFATAAAERSKLSSASRAIAEYDAEARSKAAGADVPGAQREVEAAKAAATEAVLSDDNPETLAQAKARYRAAQARFVEGQEGERQYIAHAERRSGLLAAQKAAQTAVIMAEAERLSEVYHELEVKALQARSAVEGLIDAAHDAGDHALASQLREGLRSLPANTPDQPDRFERARKALDARLGRVRQGWREAAAALAHDAGAAGPDPLEVEQ